MTRNAACHFSLIGHLLVLYIRCIESPRGYWQHASLALSGNQFVAATYCQSRELNFPSILRMPTSGCSPARELSSSSTKSCFLQDASINYDVKLTGILSTHTPSPGDNPENPEFASIVHPGVSAQFHQHLFCCRLDWALDDTSGMDDLVVSEVRLQF